MTERFGSLGYTVLSCERQIGPYAAEIYRVIACSREGKTESLIYKLFAPGRLQELSVYEKIGSIIAPFLPATHGLFRDPPPAMIQFDAGQSLKNAFLQENKSGKKRLLAAIMDRIAELHITAADSTIKLADDMHLPQLAPNPEWGNWAITALKSWTPTASHSLQWSLDSLEERIMRFYALEQNYRSPTLTLTHGDPHLDNLFSCHDQIYLIDWEWAGLSSPLRDVSLILQDVYDPDLYRFATEHYFQSAAALLHSLEKGKIDRDFSIWMLDSTLMMLAWELEKCAAGHTNAQTIGEVVTYKLHLWHEIYAQWEATL